MGIAANLDPPISLDKFTSAFPRLVVVVAQSFGEFSMGPDFECGFIRPHAGMVTNGKAADFEVISPRQFQRHPYCFGASAQSIGYCSRLNTSNASLHVATESFRILNASLASGNSVRSFRRCGQIHFGRSPIFRCLLEPKDMESFW